MKEHGVFKEQIAAYERSEEVVGWEIGIGIGRSCFISVGLWNWEFVCRVMGILKGCLLRSNGRSWSRLKARKSFGVCRSFETNKSKDF